MHPDYGYPPMFRWRVAIFASVHGAKEAVKTFNVSRSSVDRWTSYFNLRGYK